MNFEKLAGRGRRPAAGDVFIARMRGQTLRGLVVAANLRGAIDGPMEGASLIYLYDPERWSAQIPTGQVLPVDLLVPPIYTNQRPWTHGYFKNEASVSVTNRDRLEQHCFWDVARKQYVDEHLNPLPRRLEPCGEWGLVSTEWIDDRVSDALGIRRAPD